VEFVHHKVNWTLSPVTLAKTASGLSHNDVRARNSRTGRYQVSYLTSPTLFLIAVHLYPLVIFRIPFVNLYSQRAMTHEMCSTLPSTSSRSGVYSVSRVSLRVAYIYASALTYDSSWLFEPRTPMSVFLRTEQSPTS